MPRIRVHFHETPEPLIPYGSELALPATYTFTVDGYPYALKVDVAAHAEGPRITSLTIKQVEGGRPVNTEGVRTLPLARLLRSSVQLAVWSPLRDREGNVAELRDSEGNIIQAGWASFASAEVLEHAHREVDSSKRRWLLTEGHLREVAAVYEANPRNIRGKRAPTAAVMDHFKVTRPTAGRWVMEARKRGFLPPAPQSGVGLPPARKRGSSEPKG